MICCVTKAMPIHFINGKYHIKQLKSGKSCKSSLTNHTQSISHHIMPLVINAFGDRHTDRQTDRQTHILTHEPKRFQETGCILAYGWCTFGLKIVI